jgi:hypothetical protein
VEIPLLRAILRRGGTMDIRTQRQEIDRELAEELHVGQETRSGADLARAWSNRVAGVRARLLHTGDLRHSQRGIWKLTEQGRRRAQAAL